MAASGAAQAKMVARKPDWEVVCMSVWRWLALRMQRRMTTITTTALSQLPSGLTAQAAHC